MPDKKRKGRAKQELNREWECESTAVHMALKMRILNLQKNKEDELPPRTTEVDSVPQCGYILPGRTVKQTTFICWDMYSSYVSKECRQAKRNSMHSWRLLSSEFLTSNTFPTVISKFLYCCIWEDHRTSTLVQLFLLKHPFSGCQLFFLHHLSCSCTLSLPFLPPAPRPAASPL